MVTTPIYASWNIPDSWFSPLPSPRAEPCVREKKITWSNLCTVVSLIPLNHVLSVRYQPLRFLLWHYPQCCSATCVVVMRFIPCFIRVMQQRFSLSPEDLHFRILSFHANTNRYLAHLWLASCRNSELHCILGSWRLRQYYFYTGLLVNVMLGKEALITFDHLDCWICFGVFFFVLF